MTLRCFLFSSDEGTAAILRQILSSLGIEGEFCSNAVTAAERITNQPFQIVVIDWDQQPEAGLLLNTAKERKAAERPLTLAIVSNDIDAPKALHAGANSLLRKPIIPNQAGDTLKTARDLLAAKQAPTHPDAHVPPLAPPSPALAAIADQNAASLRAVDVLEAPSSSPRANFDTNASVPQLPDEFAVQAARPVKEHEPPVAAVGEPETIADPATKPSGTRGLEWYLKHKVSTSTNSGAAAAAAPIAAAAAAPSDKPDLLGYDQTRSISSPAVPAYDSKADAAFPALKSESNPLPQRKEAELFAYIQKGRGGLSQNSAFSSFRFPKRTLVPALVLATIAVVAAPQAPWHSWLQASWRRTDHALHFWLNPQPITPTQAPVGHETFTRAGDEYKLPVAEQIPDATTDPSQIQVVPVTDPTIKKTNPEGGNAMDPTAVPIDGPVPVTVTSSENNASQTLNSQPAPGPDPFRSQTQTSSQPAVSVIEMPVASHTNTAPAPSSVTVKPASPRAVQPRVVTPVGTIPPSLKSQLAPANSSPVINKPLDAAAPAIEPVEVSEAAERALLIEIPAAPAYPNSAKGQQGTVILQVLIGRDGMVQDAKFLQGSLLFARNAIDAVNQWKFRPFYLNGRPVSVQTQLTLRFKPGQ